jgi:hypothetical protein
MTECWRQLNVLNSIKQEDIKRFYREELESNSLLQLKWVLKISEINRKDMETTAEESK